MPSPVCAAVLVALGATLVLVLIGGWVRARHPEAFFEPDWSDPRLRYPTRCVDCEKQLLAERGPGTAWAAQPTKCYDCEREWAPAGLAQHTHPTKLL